MKKITCDGNEACARGSYLFTEVAGIYPITPSSPMPEFIDELSSKNEKNLLGSNVKVIEMQSEAGAAGMCHGALEMGSLVSTYTSSQGLLLMIPNMYKIAGECMPFVMHVSARTIATHALSIFGDHSDVYACLNTGFCMLSSSSVQDAYYMSIISHLSSLKASLPFMHFFDGFRTSHEIKNINILDKEEVKPLLDYNLISKFKERSLSNNKLTRGTNQNADIYFQLVESRNSLYDNVPDIVNDYMEKINKIAHTDYKPFNYYGDPNAKKVIIALGSVNDTIKEVVDYIGSGIGLITVHLLRPFSKKYLLNVLPKTVEKIAVLDRSKNPGSVGEPLYLDVLSALKGKNIQIVHGRYGLSSKDTTPGMIKSVYDNLDNPKDNFTIGINDDVTNLSLDYTDLDLKNSKEFKIYGYGSDGMVSCSKSLINIISSFDKNVQGYFAYDSKKSGGVTCSHLRFGDHKIRSTYLVSHPDYLVISKDTYLEEFDPIEGISKNGLILINSSKNDQELNHLFAPYKKLIDENNISVYVIDAGKIASNNNLGTKISMIMEKAIFELIDFIDSEKATGELIDFINKKFGSKSKEIALNNINALNDVKYNIRKINLTEENDHKFNIDNIYEAIFRRRGNDLKVSDLIKYQDGSFEKKNLKTYPISEETPLWNKDNCLQCAQCSLVCPHGAIRTYLLDNDEYDKAPNYIKENCKKALGYDGYFIIGVNANKCTGCGVCVNTCPGLRKNKALSLSKENKQEIFDYLDQNIKEKKLFKNTIKGTQLVRPKFCYSGSCAGCGETAYIKLLTQINDNLIIANATGCSSIYGGELPSLPYDLSWANSLFEDNAEFGFGMLVSYNNNRTLIREYMMKHNDPLFDKWLSHQNDYEITKEVSLNIDYDKHPYLKDYKNDIIYKNIWTIGGDGWAYDIGFGGIDHVLSMNMNSKILVLDTQVYSNTGGQASKATPIGAHAQFASSGKKTFKKDLARICMSYPNTYVAQISLGGNMMQTIKALTEASNHQGPAIVIAYCPCISHGIKGGMGQSVNMENLAVKSGYFPLFRYDGVTDSFVLDSKNPNFDLYEEFLNNQNRYTTLKKVNPSLADDLLKLNKDEAIKRFNYYKELSEKTIN